MTQNQNTSGAKAGQRAALVMAGTGVFWICATWAGSEFDWSRRTRGFFDLAALAGFGFALWMTFQLWRGRQNDKGDG